MCGLAGLIELGGRRFAESAAVVRRMASALSHRGPDGGGVWADDVHGVVMGFCRLAIVDLTDGGAQPMRSASGRYVISFNGEIYNFARLRAELESLGHRFRGHSDTEVMLASFEQWGVGEAVKRLAGMFA